MKKIYTLTATLVLVFSAGVSAQTAIGFKAGLTNSRLKGDVVESFKDLIGVADGMIITQPRNSIYAGAFAEMPLSDRFSLQPGLYYSQKGYSIKGDIGMKNLGFLGAGARADLQSHYIDIPVVIKANITPSFHVYAGPQVAYLVKNNLKVDAGLLGVSLFKRNIDVTDNFNRVDLALTAGLGYSFENGISVNAGYDHGLSRLDRNSRMESFNRAFKIGLGFRF